VTDRAEAAKVAAFWREELALVEGWLKRVQFEYVSKTELRQIARGACEALHQLMSQAVERAENAASSVELSSPELQVPKHGGLIIP
jgi:hypothetical protein